MEPEKQIMGLFRDEGRAAAAIEELGRSGFTFRRANTPFPSHKIMDAVRMKKSRVGWFTLCGGILGLCSGFGLAIFTAVQWNLVVSGKPIVSLIPFFIVGFEFTILFAVFGNVIGLLTQMRLPRLKGPDEFYDPRCSGEYFGVLAACEAGRQDELEDFFRRSGAEIKVFD